MIIRYTGQGNAAIMTKDYLREAIAECGMQIKREAATPAPRHGNVYSDSFHRVTAKLLYVAIRARVDLLMAIAFLGTCVFTSTEQDRAKLRRVLEYVKSTMDFEYTIGANALGRMRTWVDAAFAVHPDIKNHTGGVISFGTGGLATKS